MYGRIEGLENMDKYIYMDNMFGQICKDKYVWQDLGPGKCQSHGDNADGEVRQRKIIYFQQDLGLGIIERGIQELGRFN